MATYTPEQEAATKALLAKGDKLGQAASAQTGMQYNPNYGQQPAPIAASTLNQQQAPINVPPPPQPQPMPVIQTDEQLLAENAKPSAEVAQKDAAIGSTLDRINALIGLKGTEGARDQELKQTTGFNDLQKNSNEIFGQIGAINASAFQATQNSEGRLAPTFAIYGEQANIERQRSAQTFGLAAAGAAINGKIALAQQNIQDSLKAEFGGIDAKLDFEKNVVLALQRDDLSNAEQKQAQAFQLKVQERNRLLQEQKADRNATLNLMTTLGSLGVSPDILSKVQSARTYDEAVHLAAPYMQDPMAKYQLQSAQLDLQLKKVQLKTANYNYGQLGKPSPLTATEKKEAAAQLQQNRNAIEVKSSAASLARDLLSKVQSGKGTQIVGKSRLLTMGYAVDGSDAATLESLHNTLRDTLALSNIDKLKGSMSDKDVEFLRNTATNLNLKLSEDEYIRTLKQIVSKLDSQIEFTALNMMTAEESEAINSFSTLPSSTAAPQNFSPANYY